VSAKVNSADSNPLDQAAICTRCGGPKRGPFVPCKACGYTPSGTERQVAWLFSEHHLQPPSLAEAARRLRLGERPEPPRALMEHARVQMGAAPLSIDARQPLSRGQLLAMTAANLLLTPLVGMALWWGLSEDRPVASHQALRATVPAIVVVGLTWVVLILRWRLG